MLATVSLYQRVGARLLTSLGSALSPPGMVSLGKQEKFLRDSSIANVLHQHAKLEGCGQCAGRSEAEGRRIHTPVTSEFGGTVSIIDAASSKIVHTVGFEIAGMRSEPITSVGLPFTSDGRTAFIALGRANHVAVIDYRKLHSQEVSLGRPTRMAAWP
jgi:hypothetical protein